MDKYPLELVDRFRQAYIKQTGQNISLEDYARAANAKTGTNRFDAGIEAGFLRKSVLAVDRPFTKAADAAGSLIRGGAAPQETSWKQLFQDPIPVIKEAGAQMVGGAIESIPYMGMSIFSMLSPSKKVALLRSALTALPYGYISNYNKTNDAFSATMSGASMAAAPVVSRALIEKAVTPLGKALGGYVPSVGQDITDVAFQPTPTGASPLQRPFENLPKFFKDPAQMAAILGQDLPFAAASKVVDTARQATSNRNEKVRQTQGLFRQEGTTSNIKLTLESEYNLDIPDNTDPSVLRNAAELAKTGRTSEAQRKLYIGARSSLTEVQQQRLSEMEKTEAERIKEVGPTIARDPKSPTAYIDEIEFSFKTEKEMQKAMSNIAWPNEEYANMRSVNNKVFYRGFNEDTLAILSKTARKGKVNKVKLSKQSKDSSGYKNLFSVPAISHLTKAFTPRVKEKNILPPLIQADKQGLVTGNQVKSFLTGRVPKVMMEYYEKLGVFEHSSKSPNDWLRHIEVHTPMLEISPIIPFEANDAAKKLVETIESLETEGHPAYDYNHKIHAGDHDAYYTARYTGYDIEYYKTGYGRKDENPDVLIPFNEVPEKFQPLFKYWEVARKTNFRDAATGRYGIDPISVKDMDRPVDLLVRVNSDTVSEESYHFGKSDINVVASVRGYFTRPDTFFVFELQSDLGQQEKEFQQDAKKHIDHIKNNYIIKRVEDPRGWNSFYILAKSVVLGQPFDRLHRSEYISEAEAQQAIEEEIKRVERLYKDHSRLLKLPSLDNYVKLGLQAAIMHAKAQGATKLQLPDYQTAMITEVHDLQANPVETHDTLEKAQTHVKELNTLRKTNPDEHGGEYVVKPNPISGYDVWLSPEQEAGMRHFYGENGVYVNALKKLGGVFSGPVELGTFNVERRANAVLSPNYSEYFQKGQITGYEFDISGINPEHFTLYKFNKAEEASIEKVLLNVESKKILDDLLVEQSSNHELLSQREFVQMMKEKVNQGASGSDFDPVAALRILAKIGGLDRLIGIYGKGATNQESQLAGYAVDETPFVNTEIDAKYAVATAAHEMTHTSLHDFKDKNPEAYQKLVELVMELPIRTIQSFVHEANLKYGTKLDPDYIAGLDFSQNNPDWKELVAHERLAAISEIVATESIQNKSYPFLNLLPIEAQMFIRQVLDKVRAWFVSPYRYGNLLSDEAKEIFNTMYSALEKQVYKNEKAAVLLADVFRSADTFEPSQLEVASLAELSRSGSVKKSPLTKEISEEIQFVEREKLTFAQKYLSSTLALTKIYPVARTLFERLHNFRPNIQKTLLQYFEYLGQNAEGTLNPTESLGNWEKWTHDIAIDNSRLSKLGKVFEEDQKRRKNKAELPGEEQESLVTRDEMLSTYKLSEEDADMLIKIRQLVKQVSFQEFLDLAHRDYLHMAGFILTRFSDKLDKNSAEELGKVITQTSTELARSGYLAKKEKDPAKKLMLERDTNIRRFQFGQTIVKEFASKGVELQVDSPFVNKLVRLATIQAGYRIKHMLLTRQEGYAPQVRRGKYNLRYFIDVVDEKTGESTPTRQLRGFNSRKEADAWWKANSKELGAHTPTLTEKESLEEYYQNFSVSSLNDLRHQVQKEFNQALASVKDEESTPEELALLEEIRDSYGKMEQELSDAIGTKADPFKLRRKNVGGFDSNDYLPNLLDYINIKTIIGQKSITAARAKLEMAQPEFFANKDLLNTFREITNYTLHSKKSEASAARKFVYFYFLAFSIRHYLQNITQPFLVGVPELASQTKNITNAPVRLLKAYAQIRDWNRKGTTGNATLDRLLKQAEDEKVWVPTMLTHYVPTKELNTGVSAITSFLEGRSGLAKKVKIRSITAAKKFQEAMQITAELSEVMNRQVTFAMRINDEVKGNLTPQQELDLYIEGVRFTNDVNFIGDKSNRPGFIRKSGNMHGPLLFATSLMSFVINHLSLLAAYKHQFMKGSIDWKTLKKNPDRFRLNNPGVYGLMTATATLIGMAGLMGLPFAQDADELFEEIFGIRLSDAVRSKLIDLSAEFGLEEEESDPYVDAIMTGLPGAMNVGTSQSVGLGKIFSFQTGRPFTFFDLIGAPGAMAERIGSGVAAVREDPTDAENWQRMVRKSSPVALQYWHELFNTVKNNKQVDSEGRIITNELDAGANISRLLGFTPTEVSKNRASEFRARRIEDSLNRRRVQTAQQIGRLMFEYYRTQDDGKLRKARQVYNNLISKDKLTLAERQSLLTSISTDIFKRSNHVISIPTVKMREALAEVQGANPNYRPNVTSKLGERFQEGRVGFELNDPYSGMKRMMLDPATRRAYVMYEVLVERGVDPTTAWAISQKM
ncbi:MAG: hypothetical protein HC840_01240 [Leptolyngbyaceae cyanobacterium RM2_2_4]|nr:hypothetical protein [Leptolyngbyaceae cyanobacterium RM2_2_4]